MEVFKCTRVECFLKNVKNSTKCISDTEKQDFSKFQIKTILHNHLENQDNFFHSCLNRKQVLWSLLWSEIWCKGFKFCPPQKVIKYIKKEKNH